MNNNHNVPPAASVGVDDVLYLLFRHKWKIAFCTLLGLGAAAYIYLTNKTAYRSQAKIFVRYIVDKKDPRQTGPNSPDAVRPLDTRDTAVMLAEAEILRSQDSIVRAVNTVGPAKVLAAYGGSTNALEAAQLVARNLDLELGKSGGIMVLTLSHQDPDMAQRLLAEIITEYQKQHAKVHDSGASYEQVLAESDDIKKRLDSVETDLRRQKNAVHVSSLDQTKTQLEREQTELSTGVFQTEAELAEMRALVEERKKGLGESTQTNNVAEAKGEKLQPSAEDLSNYNILSHKLQELTRQETDYLLTFSESSKKVKQIREDIQEVKEKLKKLPIDPSLLAQASSGGPAAPVFDWIAARGKIAALEAKRSQYTNLLAGVRAEMAKIDGAEDNINELERQKKMLNERYAYYQQKLDEMHLDQNIDARSRNNINVIQAPTSLPPDVRKLGKKTAAAAGAGLGLGLLLALLSDFIFNPSVKRAKELEVGLKVPVLVSIPNFGRKLRLKNGHKNGSTALKKNGLGTNGEIPPWEDADPMLPYYEALRDRVVMSYNGDLHKPKIVGLTSCHAKAGVSRLATGLAASLSRDAERNVLLVGLQRNKVAVSAFAKGRPTDGIQEPAEAPGSEKELVQQNLYSLATTGRNLAGASVVQSFSDLLPKLKISDYDYIIFDLPPLTQTSGSLRLASQMERAILVVEAEETGKASAKRATTLLKASQPRLFSVLNKAEAYGPKSLREEI